MKKQLKHLLTFRDYFQTESREPIDFTSRHPPNLQHDLLYLSSYIHDAELLIENVRLANHRLYIPMQRARWELYDLVGNLEWIASTLILERIDEIRWQLTEGDSESTLIVDNIFFGESFCSNFGGQAKVEIVLKGHMGSQLRMVGDAEDMEIGFRLIDLADQEKMQGHIL